MLIFFFSCSFSFFMLNIFNFFFFVVVIFIFFIPLIFMLILVFFLYFSSSQFTSSCKYLILHTKFLLSLFSSPSSCLFLSFFSSSPSLLFLSFLLHVHFFFLTLCIIIHANFLPLLLFHIIFYMLISFLFSFFPIFGDRISITCSIVSVRVSAHERLHEDNAN